MLEILLLILSEISKQKNTYLTKITCGGNERSRTEFLLLIDVELSFIFSQPSGGLFGSKPVTGFGAATTSAPSFGFGQTSQPSAFGSTSTSLFGKPTTSVAPFGTTTTPSKCRRSGLENLGEISSRFWNYRLLLLLLLWKKCSVPMNSENNFLLNAWFLVKPCPWLYRNSYYYHLEDKHLKSLTRNGSFCSVQFSVCFCRMIRVYECQLLIRYWIRVWSNDKHVWLDSADRWWSVWCNFQARRFRLLWLDNHSASR